VKAAHDIANRSGTFRANLIAWLGSAENGFTDLFAIPSRRIPPLPARPRISSRT
jgi:hypothetical protein